jgi:hypothetical protein
MRVLGFLKLSLVGLLLLSLGTRALGAPAADSAAKLLPDKVGAVAAQSKAMPPIYGLFEHVEAKNYGVTSTAVRSYLAPAGDKFGVQVVQTESDAAAYALLTQVRHTQTEAARALAGVGTAGFISAGRIGFCRGPVFVTIDSSATTDETARVSFARDFAATLDKGADEVPSLVTHLPDWQTAQERAVYAVSLPGLQEVVGRQPVLDALSFAGGTEAVAARYEQGQLVVVEFTTPQLASEADAALQPRIAELRAQGQAAPNVYKRVGNYAVFVFGATDAQGADALAGQVKYEKVVQWLGEDPHRYERANRYWLNLSTSIIVNTVKATGLAILLCLGIGAVFGSVIFRRRRAHVALTEKYTDAGGMMRLNLDDMAAEDARPRLLPPQQD